MKSEFEIRLPESESESESEKMEAKSLKTKKKLKIDPKTGMLPPENPIKVKPPGTSDETATQSLLRRCKEAQDALKAAEDHYFKLHREVARLVITGADVQTGKYKVDKSRIVYYRRPSYKQAVIDLTSSSKWNGSVRGENYAEHLREKTQPIAVFRVVISMPKNGNNKK